MSSNADERQLQDFIWQSKKNQWIDPNRSLLYADQALLLAQDIGDKKGMAIANNLKGFCFWTFGDNDLAIEAALQALQIAQREDYPLVQANSYYILARGYMDITDGAKAREAILKAEEFANKGGDWELISSIYNLRGVILFISNQEDSALYFYNKAFETAKSHAVDSLNFPRIISNIGECHVVENPKLALTYFNEAMALAKRTGNQIAEASISDIIGHFHLRGKNLNTAETYLQSALQLARSLGLRRVIRHAYAGLVDIRLLQGRGEEAVVYLKQSYAVRDSLLNTSKVRQIVELEAKHTLQLKEQEIKILENENRIQTIWKNLLIALVFFLILISAGLYQLQQYRHRKNQEMLNLEIDYLTRQHRETEDKYKASLVKETDEEFESQDQKLLRVAISTVENNISDPQFGVEKMAAEMNMSRTNLHRKLKSIMGLPPSELIRSIRLRKAARLILSKVNSVSQIALLVGFDDYAHFSKSFKKHFGVSPTNYEEHIKAQQEVPQDA
ncbi:MAG TPA: helix-turn-helix domain-containing protein [Chryseolinea sp.]|nr:helix-turn-helix domain-containing protein [Chryseolinea sp.]